MGRPSKVDALPPAVRQALMQRIVGEGYGNYTAIETWLQEQGYTVSKSALHRIGKELKDARRDMRLQELQRSSEQATVLVELRMRCLEASVATSSEDVMATAQQYLDWVLSAD